GGQGDDLRPIAFAVAPAIAEAKQNFFSIRMGDCQVRHDGWARIIQDQTGLHTLISGEVLVEAKEFTQLLAGHYKVTIQPGSCVLVTRQGDHLAVRTLIDRAPNSVLVYCGEDNVKVSAGRSVVFAPPGAEGFA